MHLLSELIFEMSFQFNLAKRQLKMLFSAKTSPVDWGSIRALNLRALLETEAEEHTNALDDLYPMLIKVGFVFFIFIFYSEKYFSPFSMTITNKFISSF